ncbi:MAG: zinc ribbon domain-containing protein [Phycisphaerae bacterium]|nr:zinc ribbon domain-containing protein [Phycisphaerae bacterium]
MPLYEYICEKDGTVLELLRSAADADKPVQDPDGKGRVFKRRLSTFAAQGGEPGVGKGAGHVHTGSCCPCGKNAGSCGSRN